MSIISQISIAIICVSIIVGVITIVKQIRMNREFERYWEQRDKEWEERFRQWR